MQNLPIPAPAMPPQATAAHAVLDTAPASGPDSETFGAVLAREITTKKSEPKPDAALSGAAKGVDQPQPPGSDMIPLQIPPELSLTALPLLALTPGMQPDERASGDQLAILLKTAGPYTVGVSTNDQASGDRPTVPVKTPLQNIMGVSTNDQASGNQPTVPVMIPLQNIMGVSTSDQASGNQPTVAVKTPLQNIMGVSTSDQASGDQPLIAARTPWQHMMGVLPSGQPSGGQPPINALPAALSTDTSLQRNLSKAEPPARPALESDNTANFAATGKFLPLVAADEKTSRSGREAQVTQRLPEVAPLLQMSNPAATASPASASAPTSQNLQLDIRVGAPGWNGELAQKVVWMATQQQQVAEIRLNPPHLGPVEVTLTVGNDQGAQTSIQFASPHLATREAIESALPRLREMMADSGIALGNVTVSADSFQQQAEAGRQDRLLMKQPANIDRTAIGLASRSAVTFIRAQHNGLVDTFA